jgi:hypothetical protein
VGKGWKVRYRSLVVVIRLAFAQSKLLQQYMCRKCCHKFILEHYAADIIIASIFEKQ